MAEKVKSLNALKMQLGKLQKQEQTPEVMEKIDALKLQIENYTEEKPKADLPQFTHEEWQLEKGTFKRDKMLKKVILLPEHAADLNNQMKNSLKEYVEISKEE